MTSKREEFEGLLDDLLGASFDQDWSAEKKARAAVLQAYAAGREGQAVSSIDHWQKRGHHVCPECNGARVRSYRQADHLGGQYVDVPCECTHPAPKAVAANWTDADLCRMWKAAGGSFHGPHIETGTMPESKLLPFLRSLAASPARGGEGEKVTIPVEPTPGLLMSMAVRYDHALGMPGFYDQTLFGKKVSDIDHAERLRQAISTMRQLHEEVVGTGFYKPEREAEYAAMSREAQG